MPASTIFRSAHTGTASVAQSATLSSEIDIRGYAGGVLEFNSAWDGGNVTGFKVRNHDETEWLDLYDKDGTAVALTGVAASRAYEVPAVLAQAGVFKLISNTAVSAARTIGIMKKG